jgi:hypothetical protein
LQNKSLNVVSTTGSPEGDESHPGFTSLQDTLETALYIEELLSAEREWVTNRLSWLFTSQSFLLLALITFVVSGKTLGRGLFLVLTWGLPVVGITTCFFVGLGIIAAQHELKKLANVRCHVTRRINGFISPLRIPLIGAGKGHRDSGWTFHLGELPHMFLPWVLTLLWIGFLIALLIDSPLL